MPDSFDEQVHVRQSKRIPAAQENGEPNDPSSNREGTGCAGFIQHLHHFTAGAWTGYEHTSTVPGLGEVRPTMPSLYGAKQTWILYLRGDEQPRNISGSLVAHRREEGRQVRFEPRTRHGKEHLLGHSDERTPLQP